MKKNDQQFWQEQIQRQQESGLSIKKYCLKEGLILSKFYHYKKNLKPPTAQSDFLSLEEQSKKSFTMTLTGGSILKFDSLPDPTWLGEVLGSIGHVS